MTDRNVHFWIWALEGPVKLTLRPGQRLEHCTGGPTDEGYSWTCTTWSHNGENLSVDYHNDARDCDGRMTSGGCCVCDLDKIAAHPFYDEPGISGPLWRPEESYQRDYQAEAAGY